MHFVSFKNVFVYTCRHESLTTSCRTSDTQHGIAKSSPSTFYIAGTTCQRKIFWQVLNSSTYLSTFQERQQCLVLILEDVARALPLNIFKTRF